MTARCRIRDALFQMPILIGAAVLAAIEHDGVPALKSSDDLLRWLESRLTRPHDRAGFDLSTRDAGPTAPR